MNKLRKYLSFVWHTNDTYDPDLRVQELSARLWWFVLLRWLMVAGCLGAVVVGNWLAIRIEPQILIAVALLLGLANLAFTFAIRALKLHDVESRGMRLLVITQTLIDLIALSHVSYALGGFELPVLVFFLGEIIIVALFCRRIISFCVTLAAAGLAVLPLLLEHKGLIPPVSLYDSPYKASIVTDPRFAGVYLAGTFFTFVFFWYLVSEIAVSLQLREHQLQLTHERLILLDREKTQSTLLATHELKAPLAAISSYVYSLRDGYCGELPERALQVIERIGSRADMLMKKIVDIILLSNLKTLLVKGVQFKTVELNAFLAQEIAEARVTAAQRNIDIIDRNIDIMDQVSSEPSYYICGVRDQLHSMFSNILRNAITYSHVDGLIEVFLEGKRDRVTVVVRDYGIGIPEEKLERIFDEHFRTDIAARHYPNGTGLGLPIVREIARMHHAVVRVKSREGDGTEFRVTFRLQPPTHAKGASDGKDSDH